jgi:hypothetical protein
MCGLNPRSRLVLAKLETTPGSDPGPAVGTDDLFVSMDSDGIKLGVTQVGNEPASPTGYELPAAIATIKPTATYRIPLYGKGRVVGPPTSPVLPRWLSVILASCGHVNRSVSGSTQVWWSPDSIYPRTTAPTTSAVTANPCTFTVYDYLARNGAVSNGTKIRQAMVGCRVSQVRFVLTVGQWAFLEVDILGLSVQPVASTDDLSGADLDDVRTDFVRANAAQSEFTFTGGALALQSQSTTWTIDFGATQEEGDTTSAGVATVGTRQALVTASMNPIQTSGTPTPGTDITLMSDAQFKQEAASYGMNGSMTPEGRSVDIGYTIRLNAPAVQMVFDYDTTGSAVRLPTTAKAVSANSTAPPFLLLLS